MKGILFAITLGLAAASCPNQCSGHGECAANDVCDCWKEEVVINPEGNLDEPQVAWTGADCSEMTCPRGISWIEHGGDDGTKICSHKKGAECSDKGICNRKTGECACHPGYEGSACHRTKCPNSCNGHGVCQSNIKFAEDATKSLQPHIARQQGLGAVYDYIVTYQNAWDSGLHFGCACDTGYRGPDCSLIECPTNDDPLDSNCNSEETQLYEFLGADFFFKHSHGKHHPSMEPLYNQMYLFNEKYIDRKILHEPLEDFATEWSAATPTTKYPTKSEAYEKEINDKYPEGKDDIWRETGYIGRCTLNDGGSFHVDSTSVYPFYQTDEGDYFNSTDAEGNYVVDAGKIKFQTADGVKRSGDNLKAWEADNGQNNKYKRCVKLYTCGGASSGQSCSGRGLCNYATGTCKCHSGYTGNACESIESKF